ncbi:MAG TPA: hypothetical protein VEQ40_13070 [Pyrinomonadaceae bacterium]|nr:hypothetical protein [Pyrinomonadaceae bacterium]
MYLVQLLLPLYDNEGKAFGKSMLDRVRNELTERFGGVTAHRRAPAEGLWQEDSGQVTRDDVVIYEVMTEELDRAQWKLYGQELAERFRQEELMIRAISVERL